jgi:hypothetical protein
MPKYRSVASDRYQTLTYLLNSGSDYRGWLDIRRSTISMEDIPFEILRLVTGGLGRLTLDPDHCGQSTFPGIRL